MKSCMFCFAVFLGLCGASGFGYSEEFGVELVSVNPHPAVERTHVCKIVKVGAADVSDCNDPKCAAGGADVDMALSAKGVKRICKTIGASVNRGFDVTYLIRGEKHVAWTAHDPGSDLERIGLTAFEEHSPLNPVCARMSFKEASAVGECSQIK